MSKTVKGPTEYQSLGLPVELIDKLREFIKKSDYRSMSSFVQQAIREKMSFEEKRMEIERLSLDTESKAKLLADRKQSIFTDQAIKPPLSRVEEYNDAIRRLEELKTIWEKLEKIDDIAAATQKIIELLDKKDLSPDLSCDMDKIKGLLNPRR
jgi:Arc/MetJ-type ribon-helix-helix transcriptional regulator